MYSQTFNIYSVPKEPLCKITRNHLQYKFASVCKSENGKSVCKTNYVKSLYKTQYKCASFVMGRGYDDRNPTKLFKDNARYSLILKNVRFSYIISD